MSAEVARICFIALGGVLGVFLAVAPRVACRRYASAVVEGRDRAAGLWAFLAAHR
jgi:hypothetical protein